MIAILKKYKQYLNSHQLFILLGILTLVPFLVLSFFNHPATDDYYFSYYSKIYTATESPFWMYNNVGGRYFANTILCFNPVYFDCTYLFKIIPILLLVVFCFSVYIFISSLLSTSSKSEKIAFTGLISSLFLVQLPDSCSAFYWMPGAISYQLSISLSLFSFAFLVQFYKTKKVVHFFLATLFLICSLGSSEITIILTLILLYFTAFYSVFILKKINLPLLLIIIIASAFSALAILAPGNAVRAKAIPVTHEFVYSVAHSITTSVGFILKWLPIILLCSLFFVETIYKKIDLVKNKSIFINPILAFGILFSMLFFGFFTGFWINKDVLPDRAINTIYFFFILATIYLLVCTLHYLNKKHQFVIQLTSSSKYVLGIIIFISMFANTPIYTAYRDLLTGKASKYSQEMNHRLDLIVNSNTKKVVVPALKNQPETIFKPIIMGLTTDVKDWKNEELSIYFDKEIVVQPNDFTITE
ncbi:hypothetical protein [Flavobacterium sp.]|jgi:hypothetical protein|uniref:hypothetical protein n=1 Tax=Flavobacterium sp. TaxID=239 RepID=UPI0037BFF554